MHPKRYALFGGLIMFAMGALAFIPSLSDAVPSDFPLMNVDTSYGLFLGIFPMNIFNKVALIIFGLGGILAANAKNTSLPMSIWWSRAVFFVMGAAAILGFFPETYTLHGNWPLFGKEIWSHGVFAVFGLYFGYVLKNKAHREVERRFPTSTKTAHGV